ncbi:MULTISPECIES: response regulator [unclassified Fusibacter]|uniref:response regulator n=1 Tax=unclassified Fusibacter TaxID=2624464 RepID=UPI0010125AB4|nr:MULTISPECIES: response regulator [unclassified Fusibacter]MCK8059464.1 response regulator [Fusibacter sp. A2]NPE21072.1 response regulator [Fusibacter sp. A1]RXV62346.1 response regulator [Fusibacter sp. A1]
MARILIADDSAVIRKTLKRILIGAGHDVVEEAKNGVEAVELYAKSQPDMVTMDISMPIMSGIEAVKNIVNKYHDAKIIMISAIDEKNQVFEALECGAKHYIIKPFNENTVLKILDVVMDFSQGEGF